MGQAVDLPDPLEPPAASAAPDLSSADDLLSQLAGEEIDRLLAEAEVEKTDAPPVEHAPPVQPPVASAAPEATAATVAAEPAIAPALVAATAPKVEEQGVAS